MYQFSKLAKFPFNHRFTCVCGLKKFKNSERKICLSDPVEMVFLKCLRFFFFLTTILLLKVDC